MYQLGIGFHAAAGTVAPKADPAKASTRSLGSASSPPCESGDVGCCSSHETLGASRDDGSHRCRDVVCSLGDGIGPKRAPRRL
jgi:hypothetical protein